MLSRLSLAEPIARMIHGLYCGPDIWNWSSGLVIMTMITMTTSLAHFGSTLHVPWDDITWHYNDVIMGTISSQITSLTIVYSIVYWDADQRKHQSSAWLAFVRGIHRRPVNSPHKWPVTRKMFPFDDGIMGWCAWEPAPIASQHGSFCLWT